MKTEDESWECSVEGVRRREEGGGRREEGGGRREEGWVMMVCGDYFLVIALPIQNLSKTYSKPIQNY
ncbi:hypothetical protein [Phormidesmis sp. 146-33]